ncbi:SLC13 family permease [Varunaivibrio sulfuroxidans]|uniref:TrkA family protein n=1 Tax=Varunaivibrio sulfuroxidans TaxID=1773489 RepID=A0A4R3JFM8_9PROT|nr:SLC13 family permease [Varunaivibrio sulfuroxidans]TCS63490.1 TrkA family protein [Varunaivibrio sulfuroxidans]WES30365.1 SLC13 family permease [Varunaivibrio sulfuroxidans]
MHQAVDLHAVTSFQMAMTYALIVGAFALYAWGKVSIEVVSLGVLSAVLIFFYVFPVIGADGRNLLGPERLLSGFANPALITVLALLVIGQGMVRTGVLDQGARIILACCGDSPRITVGVALLCVLVVSAFLNNIPVVVIFIPIMQAIAAKFSISSSKLMMPLSFASILGGMTTLIGSASNLLVNSALIDIGQRPFAFFDFTVPGLVLAAVGMVFLLTVAPRLLRARENLTSQILDGAGRQYIAQITVSPDSNLVGKKTIGGIFPDLTDMTLRLVQRGEEGLLPPFEDYQVRPGDVLVVAATRQALSDALTHDPSQLYPDLTHTQAQGAAGDETKTETEDERPWHQGERMLAEVMVAPASRLIGQTLPQIGFRFQTRCIVLAIQRRSRMIRKRLTDIRLQDGDVLLLQGSPADIEKLRTNRDVVLLEWLAAELPAVHHARRAAFILLGVVLAAATGVVPIVIAALAGVTAMLASGVLNLRQAGRAIDSKILTMIPLALALGAALNATGGAIWLVKQLTQALGGAPPVVILSLFFLVMVVLTNVISSKAMAVLFTPIAVDMALATGSPVEAFAVAVVLAANCSFASPIGYQTNLLVMGPGHYRFSDFARVGVPVIVVVWLAFSVFVPWYYGMMFP